MNRVTIENVDGKQVVEIDGKQYALTEIEKPILKLRPDPKDKYWMLRENGTVNSAFYFTCNDEIMWDQSNGFFTKSAAQKTGERRRLTQKWLDAIATVNHERGYTPVFDGEQNVFCFGYWDIDEGPRFAGFWSFLYRPLTHCFHKDDLPKLRKQFNDDDIKLIYLGE